MAWVRAPLLLALGLGNAEYLRTLQEVNLVPEDEAANLKKQEEAQRALGHLATTATRYPLVG